MSSEETPASEGLPASKAQPDGEARPRCEALSDGEAQSHGEARPDGWLARQMRQFGRPVGSLGRVAGRLMARRNASTNRWAVELADVASGDRVLEIGFGPGVGVGLLAERGARVEGIDASEAMVNQAVRRNIARVRSGQVELRVGSASQLPFDDGLFDRIVTVFSLHHWPDVPGALAEAHRVLAPGGRLVVLDRIYDPDAGRFHPASNGLTDDRLAGVTTAVGSAGFVEIETQHRRIGSDPVVALSALRPSGG